MPSIRSSVAIESSYSRRSCLEAGAERGLLGGEHGLLGEPGGDRRAPGDALRQRHGLLEPLVLAGDHVHEAQPGGLLGVDAPAGQHQLHRPLLSDHASQSLRSAAAGDDPEGDLGLAELGRLRGDDQVAEQGQLAAAAEREARDGGDQRRLAGGEPPPERRRRMAQRLLEACARASR